MVCCFVRGVNIAICCFVCCLMSVDVSNDLVRRIINGVRCSNEFGGVGGDIAGSVPTDRHKTAHGSCTHRISATPPSQAKGKKRKKVLGTDASIPPPGREGENKKVLRKTIPLAIVLPFLGIVLGCGGVLGRAGLSADRIRFRPVSCRMHNPCHSVFNKDRN